MLVEVDAGSPVPPYEQIRSQLARLIETGALAHDAQLPTIRQLAADLGLATNTVARAYRELEAAGLVRSRVRHGTTVVAPKPLPPKEVRRRLEEAAHSYVALAFALGVPEHEALAAVRRHYPPSRPARHVSI